MKKGLGIFLAFLGGCAVHQASPLSRVGTIVVYPHFSTTSQALLLPNTLSSIATLDIVPTIESSPNVYWPISRVTGNPTTDTDPNRVMLSHTAPVDPSRPLIFRNLKPNARYRLLGQAYNASGSRISLDASSSVDLQLTNDDRPAMAALPVVLTDTPFAASTSVNIKAEGRADYFKAYFYLQSNGALLMSQQTVRDDIPLNFANLQANTNYRVVAEAYKFGQMMASNSVTLAITNDTAPATTNLNLTIPYVVSTLAGNRTPASSDGVGTGASFYEPLGITLDNIGNLYVSDYSGQRIRKVTPGGVVSTVAGGGVGPSTDGAGTSAAFYGPIGLTFDNNGNLFVSEYNAGKIRKIAPNTTVSTFAGNGTLGWLDATGTIAGFNHPFGLAFDSAGNLFVADQGSNRVRKITPAGVVTTFAGNGTGAVVDGTGTSARLFGPTGLVIDSADNVFISDIGGNCIRKITPQGVVTTIAGNGITGQQDGTGTSATFTNPAGINLDGKGNLYVAEHSGSRLRRISSSGVVTTLAGGSSTGYADGTGTAARFYNLGGVTIDANGNLYLVDRLNHLIRKMQ